ncbi:TPA: hypothetical protein DIC40_07085 [Patescibacteria group bacterium]|nr:hypothetical protein [Candidatus Gracilibacteria bacterium]
MSIVVDRISDKDFVFSNQDVRPLRSSNSSLSLVFSNLAVALSFCAVFFLLLASFNFEGSQDHFTPGVGEYAEISLSASLISV